MSILNSLKGLVTDQLVSGVASHLGESNDGISKAITGIMPTLLGGMMGAKQEDHSMLSGLLSQAGNLGGGNLVGDLLGGLTGGSNNAGISGIGSSLVSGLLGNKMGGAVSMISSLAGIKSGSASSLMSIGGSLLASFLGKKMIGDNLNFGGIMNMITGQKDEIVKAAPAGFAETLGLGSLFGNAKETVTNTVASATSTVTNAASTLTGGDDNKGGGMKWLWPLLLLLGIGAAAYWFINRGKTTEAPAMEAPAAEVTSTEPATTAVVSSVDSVASAATAAASTTTATAAAAVTAAVESIKVKLIDGTTINANKGGIEDKLVAFLGDPSAKLAGDADKTKDWFNFDNLNFDLGKATITKGSMVQVENLAAILKAYPKMKIKIGGYTDKAGDDAKNLSLSQSRADAVLSALKAKGVGAQIVKAEGYGEALATVAETASDEARRVDRKTAVKILEK
jgi:outer membrane protein OmpA-like peptidoglycan-associated protein